MLVFMEGASVLWVEIGGLRSSKMCVSTSVVNLVELRYLSAVVILKFLL